jgi:non-heme chloroperoxidase
MKTLSSWVALALLVSCAHVAVSEAPTGWVEPAGLHQTRFVTVANGVSLEVVDWGGSGPPVLFVPGLSGTAHQYDEFAPGLTDRFHVFGLTRRGWGLSSVPDTGYGVPTLVADLVKVLDALKVDRVSLIGHSAGGEELTAFAVAHSDRVERLVYLDAAYDRTDPQVQPGGQGDCVNVEPPVEADLATAEAFGAWFARSRGVQLPASEVHMLFDHHGPSEAAAMEYVKSLVRPDYSRVTVPALAVYAVPESAADFYPGWSRLDAAARAKAQACFERGKEQAVAQASRADFRAHAAKGQVVELAHSSHYPFITSRDVVLGHVKAFLLGGGQ